MWGGLLFVHCRSRLIHCNQFNPSVKFGVYNVLGKLGIQPYLSLSFTSYDDSNNPTSAIVGHLRQRLPEARNEP